MKRTEMIHQENLWVYTTMYFPLTHANHQEIYINQELGTIKKERSKMGKNEIKKVGF